VERPFLALGDRPFSVPPFKRKPGGPAVEPVRVSSGVWIGAAVVAFVAALAAGAIKASRGA
jgi:hypothetical protein